MATERHTHKFSHEFEAGPSGAARSYWDIRRGMKTLGTVCLHHRREIDPALTIQSLCHMLDETFEAGRADKAREVRGVLEL